MIAFGGHKPATETADEKLNRERKVALEAAALGLVRQHNGDAFAALQHQVMLNAALQVAVDELRERGQIEPQPTTKAAKPSKRSVNATDQLPLNL